MTLSRRTKIVVGLSVVISVIAYLILLDVGINAGRIHHGVSVQGLDVGGLTEVEAFDVIQERGEELRFEPVVFTTEGFDCNFVPDEIGWGPQSSATADAALLVGREGWPFAALEERARAWFGGIDVEWAGKPRGGKVTELIDECEMQARGIGLTLKRKKMRRKIRVAIVTWPRRLFNIPLER